jgi:hypothetical protein
VILCICVGERAMSGGEKRQRENARPPCATSLPQNVLLHRHSTPTTKVNTYHARKATVSQGAWLPNTATMMKKTNHGGQPS